MLIHNLKTQNHELTHKQTNKLFHIIKQLNKHKLPTKHLLNHQQTYFNKSKQLNNNNYKTITYRNHKTQIILNYKIKHKLYN